MKMLLTLFCCMLLAVAKPQLLSWTPEFPTDADNITITMDANYGNKGLLNQTVSDVYVHTGVITNLSTGSGNWRYVKFDQNFEQPNPALQATSLGNNKWQFTISNVRSYYGVPAGETIQKISILFRSGNGGKKQANADGSDMYIPVSNAGLQVRLTAPFKEPMYVPQPAPIIKSVGDAVSITAKASTAANMRLLFNGSVVASQSGAASIAANSIIMVAGNQRIISEAELGGLTVRDTIDFFATPATVTEALPAGVKDGANYTADNTGVTLVLYAPNKTSVGVVGDFNNWEQTLQHQMKRTPDGLRYWVTIGGLVSGQEYAYQYVVDGSLRVADYLTEKVLDPWNDQYINQAPYTDRYPSLKSYPAGKTSGIVSVLEPGKAAYSWGSATTNFKRADKRNIMVYELLLRDFLARNDWKTLRDTLGYLTRIGINTLHLMPFNEFEGNNSWGYNPSFMFAVDKFYGPENQLKQFIDSCHGRGIAVVMDLVLNHQFGQSPMVQMYWDAANNKPATNSPWFNPDAKHPFNVGYDMNHEAPATIDFVQKVMTHWLTDFKLDGFRWDLSKGFTQVNNPSNTDAWSAYDQSRVNIWQRIYGQSQEISPNCYMILEHLGSDQEEATLANIGMLLWGKMTNEFNEASMGYQPGSDFSRAYHTTRWSAFGGNNTPHLMAYAESHDEERLMFKNVRFGNNVNPAHNTRLLSVAARRMQAVAAFLFTIPGPKMLWQFGELAYDSSINMCENLSIGECRTSPKPPAWAMPAPGGTQDYNANTFRRNLRDMYGKIISLRTKYPAYLPAFVTNNVDFSVNGLFKYQRIQSSALNIVVVGNFDVISQAGSVTFPSAGTWYLYAHNVQAGAFAAINGGLTETVITVPEGQLTQSFNLAPGTFLLLLDKNPALANPVYTFTGNGNWDNAANWSNGTVPPAILPSGAEIIISPSAGGECVLNTSQTISSGAKLTVKESKNLRILQNLQVQ